MSPSVSSTCDPRLLIASEFEVHPAPESSFLRIVGVVPFFGYGVVLGSFLPVPFLEDGYLMSGVYFDKPQAPLLGPRRTGFFPDPVDLRGLLRILGFGFPPGVSSLLKTPSSLSGFFQPAPCSAPLLLRILRVDAVPIVAASPGGLDPVTP